VVQIRFCGKPSIRKLTTKMCWPWNFADDFNDLDRQTRNGIICKSDKMPIKKEIVKAHPHQYQKVKCDRRCRKAKPEIPLEAYDLRARLDDTLFTTRAKERMTNDALLSEERCNSIASSLALELMIENVNANEIFENIEALRNILEGNDSTPRSILTQIARNIQVVLCKKITDK
jgi:hypothetical protein